MPSRARDLGGHMDARTVDAVGQATLLSGDSRRHATSGNRASGGVGSCRRRHPSGVLSSSPAHGHGLEPRRPDASRTGPRSSRSRHVAARRQACGAGHGTQAPDAARRAKDFAVELDLLESNTVKALEWTVPASGSREIDRRIVVNHRQARSLLEAVSLQQPSGPRLVAFFALMYYSALRPRRP
jgi:hypothetical protein